MNDPVRPHLDGVLPSSDSTPRMPSPPRLLLPALVLLACGPDKADDTGDTAGTADTTATPTGGEVCEMFAADELGPAVKLTVINKTDGPVWVPSASCGGAPKLTLVNAAAATDDSVPRWSDRGECIPTFCHDFLGQGDCSLACPNCAPPVALRIEPGASIETAWAGDVHRPSQMTAECAAGLDCQRDCYVREQAPPATYRLMMQASFACDSNCECDAPSGWCPIYEAIGAIGAEDITTEFAYPDTKSVELAIVAP